MRFLKMTKVLALLLSIGFTLGVLSTPSMITDPTAANETNDDIAQPRGS